MPGSVISATYPLHVHVEVLPGSQVALMIIFILRRRQNLIWVLKLRLSKDSGHDVKKKKEKEKICTSGVA